MREEGIFEFGNGEGEEGLEQEEEEEGEVKTGLPASYHHLKCSSEPFIEPKTPQRFFSFIFF